MKKTNRIFNKKIICILIYTTLSICSLSKIYGKIYYVDKDNKFGNGANNNWPGTMEQPKSSFQGDWFQDELKPGDTVIVRQANSYAEMRFKGSMGAKDNPIVIMPYSDEKIISDNSIAPGQFWIRIMDGASHIEIYGPLEIIGREYSYTALKNNVGLKLVDAEIYNGQHGPRLNGTKDSELINCHIHDLSVNGVQMRGSESAATGEFCQNILFENITVHHIDDDRTPDNSDADGFHSYGGENITFKNCSANNNAEDGFDLNCNGTLINCRAIDNSAGGIKIWRRDQDNFANKTITVINSLIINNGNHNKDTNPGIKVSMGAGLNLYHSVVSGNYDQGIHVRFANDDEPYLNQIPYLPVNIYNSIICNTLGGTGILERTHPDGPLVKADYNLYFNNAGSDAEGFSVGSNSIIATDPLFKNLTNNDFSLNSTSPAIDKAVDLRGYPGLSDEIYLANIISDFTYKTRPVGSKSDIGAYEYGNTLGGTINKLFTENLKVYPNPSSDQIFLSKEFKLSSFKIISLDGTCLKQGNLKDATIDVSTLPRGIYILTVKNTRQIASGKILIE